jgi:hypothetical protein
MGYFSPNKYKHDRRRVCWARNQQCTATIVEKAWPAMLVLEPVQLGY